MCGCSHHQLKNPQFDKFNFNHLHKSINLKSKSTLSIAISVSKKYSTQEQYKFHTPHSLRFWKFPINPTTASSLINNVYKMSTEICLNCRGSLLTNFNSEINSDHYRCSPTFSNNVCPCHKSQNLSFTMQTRSCKLYQFSQSVSRTVFKVLLWILVIFPLNTMANPLPLHDQEAGPSSGHKSKRPHEHPSKWINPCRIPSSLPIFPMDMDIEIITQSDSEIIQNIITQVSKAENQAKRFMNNYYRETFGDELERRDKFTEVHYDFLKDVNDKVRKSLGAQLTTEELEELKVAETLRSMYSGLQMFAVGLEQIVLDQSVYGGNFHKDFQEAEYQLKYVLCELQIAMIEKGIQHEDVTREIMSGDHRDIDCDTIRNIRDWVIFRDYVNTLEYIQQSFQHFLTNSESSS